MTLTDALFALVGWLMGSLTVGLVVATIRPTRIGTPPPAGTAPDTRPIPLDDLLGPYARRPAALFTPARIPDDLEAAFARPAAQPAPAWIWRCTDCRDQGLIGGCTRCGRTPP